MTTPAVSIIVARAPGVAGTPAVLAAVKTAAEGVPAEILLVGWGPEEATEAAFSDRVRVVGGAPDSLVPRLWGIGARAASAPVVALLSTEFIPAPDWLRVLMPMLSDSIVGVAGAITTGPSATTVTSAMHLLRFGSFLPRNSMDGDADREIPGDGALYRREPIMRHADLLEEGLWEADFHRRWRGEGFRLRFTTRPLLTYLGGNPLTQALKVRRRHGRHYGATVVLRQRHSRLRHLLGAPLVPAALTARVIRRASGTGFGGRYLLRALPVVGLLAGAWAVGEAEGAVSAGRSSGTGPAD